MGTAGQLGADTFIDGCGVVPDIPLGRGVRIRFGQGPASLSVAALGDEGLAVAGHYGALTVGILAANAVQVQAHPPTVD